MQMSADAGPRNVGEVTALHETQSTGVTVSVRMPSIDRSPSASRAISTCVPEGIDIFVAIELTGPNLFARLSQAAIPGPLATDALSCAAPGFRC